MRTLVIGYGNLDRQDDGVAYEIVNALRRRLGQPPLAEEDTGLEQTGTQVDSVFVTQLAPELLDTARDYGQVIFVDAHVNPGVEDVHRVGVGPEFASAAFTHHMTPSMFLALLKVIYHRAPAGHIVSVRGHGFDFERGLSDATRSLVEPAVVQILHLLAEPERDLPE